MTNIAGRKALVATFAQTISYIASLAAVATKFARRAAAVRLALPSVAFLAQFPSMAIVVAASMIKRAASERPGK